MTHEYDGGNSRASSNATSGLLAVTEFLPLEKAFGIILGFMPDHTERQMLSKGSLLQPLLVIFVVQR